MKRKCLFSLSVFTFLASCTSVFGQDLSGLYLTTGSSNKLKIEYNDNLSVDLNTFRNFGFQLNLPTQLKKISSVFYEFNLGVDSYSFDLGTAGNIRSFFIFYGGCTLGYEYQKYLLEQKHFRFSGSISILRVQPTRSNIIDEISTTNYITLSQLIGSDFVALFSPRIAIDYNWVNKISKRGYKIGISAAHSFQNVLEGEFTAREGNVIATGSFSKNFGYIGLHFGVNVSHERKVLVAERKKQGLTKDPKPIDNTISKLTFSVNFGTGSKIFISNPNVFTAEKSEHVNLNLTYGFDLSRSIPILDKYHALLAFSYAANDSKLRAVHRNPITDETFTIDTKLNTIHIISTVLGYNLLKNKKNRDAFFQISPQLNLNLNLIQNQSISILNPENNQFLWLLSARDEGRLFFSSKLSIDHLKKMKDNRYLRLGISIERGRDLLVGELVDSSGRISEFYQNNFAIRFHVGISLQSERNKI